MSFFGVKLRVASRRLASQSKERAVSEELAPVESVVVILDTKEARLVKCFREMKDFLRVKDENFQMIFSVASKFRKQDCEGICFDPADITWSGNFTAQLKEIRDRRYDLLVCFAKENNKAAQLMSAALDARLKVSREIFGSDVFDLSISTGTEEAEIFTEELKKYLRILNRTKE